jgi:hypothetical protein
MAANAIPSLELKVVTEKKADESGAAVTQKQRLEKPCRGAGRPLCYHK